MKFTPVKRNISVLKVAGGSLLMFLSLAFLVSGIVLSAPPDESTPPIYLAEVRGAIVPVVADYIDQSIRKAEENRAQALIILLNTPGGLYTSTQTIVERILNARVPVIVYVYPAGGWAASAGTFITLSANIAVMSPATRLGAAHPVGGPGEAQPSETLGKKITEDAAALIRGIATQRNRNAVAAETAVRESNSFTANEAIEQHLVDFQAGSLDSLLEQLDGREANLLSGTVTLHTQGLTSQDLIPTQMSGIQKFLATISDPNVAYILMALGMTALFVELSNPGLIFPGIVGAMSLLLGLYALGVLQANFSAVALIVLAIGLFIADVFVTSHGVLTAGGIASLVVGSLLLFSGNPLLPGVDWWLIAIVATFFAAFFVFVIGAVVTAHRRQATTGREGLVGKVAVARSPLAPTGVVHLEGELWKATSLDGNVEPGEEVIVRKVQGLQLWVTKAKKEGKE